MKIPQILQRKSNGLPAALAGEPSPNKQHHHPADNHNHYQQQQPWQDTGKQLTTPVAR